MSKGGQGEKIYDSDDETCTIRTTMKNWVGKANNILDITYMCEYREGEREREREREENHFDPYLFFIWTS